MLTFTPITKDDVDSCPCSTVGPLFGNHVSVIKAAISKATSGGNYHYTGMGIGKYGFKPQSLMSLGYTNELSEWIGLHGYSSQSSFLHSEHTQEQAMDRYLTILYTELFKFGAINSSTTLTDVTGLIIAAYFLDVMPVVRALRNKAQPSEQLDFYMRVGKQADSMS